MRRLYSWLLVFTVSSISALLINKHVLSDLHFTYPTIFQSWQMFVVTLLFLTLYYFNQIEVEQFSVKLATSWFPAVFFFSLAIYSGSVALSNISVPIFCLFQQTLVHGAATISDVYVGKHHPTIHQTILIIASMAAVMFVAQSDPMFSVESYKWILIHCFSFGYYSHYVANVNDVQIKESDKALLNAVSSVFLLLLFGYVNGETVLVQQFPHIFQRHFHLACVCSGVLGGIAIFAHGQLKQLVSLERLRFYNSLIMFIACLISPLFFDAPITISMASVILLGFLSVNAFGYFSSVRVPLMEEEVEKTGKSFAL